MSDDLEKLKTDSIITEDVNNEEKAVKQKKVEKLGALYFGYCSY
jgi:hypothetical protein